MYSYIWNNPIFGLYFRLLWLFLYDYHRHIAHCCTIFLGHLVTHQLRNFHHDHHHHPFPQTGFLASQSAMLCLCWHLPRPCGASQVWCSGYSTIYSLRLRDSRDSQDSETPKTPRLPRLRDSRDSLEAFVILLFNFPLFQIYNKKIYWTSRN